ncbi:hypothetical protein JXO59_13035 [candidate division KSB1 bacterium]|nr:hypothetical protein [candidate division KSB1 bacterium]
MHRILTFTVIFPLFIASVLPPGAYSQPPQELLQQGIALGINQQFEQALTLFSSIESRYPDHPAGPFFKAAIYQSMMLDYESMRWRALFYKDIEKSIVLAKALLTDNADPYAQFYLGAAYVFKSSQLAREKKYFSSLRSANKAMGFLKSQIQQDSSFCDPYLGIGSYDYWRSKFTLLLSWLPFFPDRRAEGIAAVLKAAECSIFSKWAAYSNLCWIFIKEEEYDAAIQYAQWGLHQFPQSRFFLWPLAEARFKKGAHQGAIESYLQLLHSIQREKINNHYNEIVIHWKLAQSYEALGNAVEARRHCLLLLQLQPEEEVKDRIKDKRKAAQKILAALQRDDLPAQ